MARPHFRDAVTTAQAGPDDDFVATLPTYEEDDVVLIEVTCANTDGQTDNVPAATGWALLPSFPSGGVQVGGTATRHKFVFYRVMDGSEGSTVSFTISGTSAATHNYSMAVAGSWYGVDTADPFDGNYVGNNATSSTPSSGNVTTADDDTRIVTFFTVQNTGAAFTETSPTIDRTSEVSGVTSGLRLTVTDRGAGAAGTYTNDGTYGASVAWAAASIALRGTGDVVGNVEADVQVFNAGAGQTWTKPADALLVRVIAIGAGGGGGSGAMGRGTNAYGGAAGGGGGVADELMLADDLPGTVTVDVGAGGTGGAATAANTTTTNNGNAGNDGGASSFGTYLRVGGGGAGGAGLTTNDSNAGGAGGALESASGGSGGAPATAGSAGIAFRAADPLNPGNPGLPSEYGGAAGGASRDVGGDSVYAGPGGGGGGGAGGDGAHGGATGQYSTGSAANGGAGGTAGVDGGDGDSVIGTYCGNGGGGGGSGTDGAGGDGGIGGIGAGGGGGGSGQGIDEGTNFSWPSGAGGDGGDGQILVITYVRSTAPAGETDTLTNQGTATITIDEVIPAEEIVNVGTATHTLVESGFTGETNVILHSATNTPTILEYIIGYDEIYTNEATATHTLSGESITEAVRNTQVNAPNIGDVYDELTNLGVNTPTIDDVAQGSVADILDATADADSTGVGGYNVSGVNIPSLTDSSTDTIDDDDTPPILQAIYVVISTNQIILVFNENLDPGSIPDVSDFTLTVNGSPCTLTNVAINLNQVILTFSCTITDEDEVVVVYDPPVSDPLQDESGNDVEPITGNPRWDPDPIFTDDPPDPVDHPGTNPPSFGARGLSTNPVRFRAWTYSPPTGSYPIAPNSGDTHFNGLENWNIPRGYTYEEMVGYANAYAATKDPELGYVPHLIVQEGTITYQGSQPGVMIKYDTLAGTSTEWTPIDP